MQLNDWFGLIADAVGIIGAFIGLLTFLRVRSIESRRKKLYEKLSRQPVDIPGFLLVCIGKGQEKLLSDMEDDAKKKFSNKFNPNDPSIVQKYVYDENITFSAPKNSTTFSSSNLPIIMNGIDAALGKLHVNTLYLYYAGPSFIAVRLGERFKNHFHVHVMHYNNDGKKGYYDTGASFL